MKTSKEKKTKKVLKKKPAKVLIKKKPIAKKVKVKKPVIKKPALKKKPVKKVLKKKVQKPTLVKKTTKKVTIKKKTVEIKKIKKVVKKEVFKKPKKVKKAKKVKTAKHIHKIKEEIVAFPAESLFKAKIKVVGIGGGGGSIVSEIGRTLGKATFVIADTDVRALKKRSGIKPFEFGNEFTHGLGTGVDPDLARRAAESEREKITNLFKDQDIVILIASLGGGLGSGATQIFAEAAKSFGGITLGIFTLPFKFEGKNKSRIALKALRELKTALNVSITIPNERIFKVIDSNTSITEAFSTVNKNLIESLESLIDLIYSPGMINIDFADLRTILSGSGNFAFLNTVYASGKDRATEIMEKILVNPLYQTSNFVAEKILFNISGGSNLNMFEVEKISRFISEINPKAKIIFGISRNPSSKNKIKTTLLMTGPGKEDILKEEKEEVIEEKVKEVVVKEPVLEVKKEEVVKSVVKEKIAKVKKIKQPKKAKKEKKKVELQEKEVIIPIFNKNTAPAELSSKLSVVNVDSQNAKKTIRRSALEIKKAEELEKDKRLLQEEEWEIPAFLRRVKF